MATVLRATFKKGEALRYTGHLDILRTFVRGMRRADIPFKYSEGFNPHAVMSFALPLGVGTTSECEIVEIQMKEQIPVEDFIKAVNEKMPPNSIEVLYGEYSDAKTPVIVKAEYVIEYENDKDLNYAEIEEALSGKEILIEKKSKRQMKEINLSDHIFESKIQKKDEKSFTLYVTVSAGNTFNIKPQLLTDGLKSVCPSFNPILVLPNRKKFIFEGE
ncbi:MAG: TIGR03936 family radical SAM-associated protein [Clostridia bacterium]|nr:TIGR03936 family radical SAM-associated protein [Clostridia bacterium]